MSPMGRPEGECRSAQHGVSGRQPLAVALQSSQRGIGLVEIMVGLVIGLIATAVIFQTFAVSEGFKRNTTSAGDAQQNGLFSTFTLALELANAGAGMAAAADFLAQCPDTGDVRTTLRPLPVVVFSSGKSDQPDAFVTSYSVSSRLAYPARFVAEAPAGTPYQVQSPTGFAKDDMVVPVEPGRCERTRITAISAPDAAGIVSITHDPALQDFSAKAVLFNLGNWDRAQRVQYDVNGGVLRSLDLYDVEAQRNPLASNIVNMKVQYGIDDTGDGLLDTWVEAKDQWAPARLLAAELPAINRIKAVRIGFVVRSAQYDRDATRPFAWVLFDCDATDKDTCPGRLEGSITPEPGGGGYRYRVYETVVPLRNALWNRRL